MSFTKEMQARTAGIRTVGSDQHAPGRRSLGSGPPDLQIRGRNRCRPDCRNQGLVSANARLNDLRQRRRVRPAQPTAIIAGLRHPTFVTLTVSDTTLMSLARWLIVLAALPVTWAAAQGYSVLYLFLLADLLCSAAAFPVFFGLFHRRYTGIDAVISTSCGLMTGLAMFPAPGAGTGTLLESFVLATLVPVGVSLLLLRLLPVRP